MLLWRVITGTLLVARADRAPALAGRSRAGTLAGRRLALRGGRWPRTKSSG